MLRRFVVIAALLVVSSPAFAGTLNFANGKGMWQSALCSRPVPPAFVGLGSDASAATLNAATAGYNAFVKQSQDYQACLSAEAKSDGESANALIAQTVDRQMQDAQGEVERSKGQLFGRNAPTQPLRPVAQPAIQQQQPMMAPQPVVQQEMPQDLHPPQMPQQQQMQQMPTAQQILQPQPSQPPQPMDHD